MQSEQILPEYLELIAYGPSNNESHE